MRDEVAAVVALGVLDRLGDERQRGEVQDGVVAAGQRGGGRLGVEQVDLLQPRALRDRRGVAAREAVEHGDVVAGVEQLGGHDRADVAGAAGDEELHAAQSDTSLSVPFRACPSA